MNLHEFQAKDVFRSYGIPVPAGRVAASAEEAASAARALGGAVWVVKAQVHAGGRGKAGGVKLTRDLEAVRAAAAAMLGVHEFYRVGGAQAIAAFAYGTESIPRVDKIVGPGNAYVTAAKKLVAFDCAIDFLAGPTEAVILSDSGKPDFIAADLISQAEHDVDALVFFITTSRKLAGAVSEGVTRLAKGNRTAQASLQKHSAIFIAKSKTEAREWANRLAPEHITIDANDAESIKNAGEASIQRTCAGIGKRLESKPVREFMQEHGDQILFVAVIAI